MNTPPTFWRSPRFRPTLPTDEIEIPAPPPDPRSSSGYTSIVGMLLPAVLMMGVMVVVGRVMGTSNWLLFSLPMMLVSSLAGLLSYLLQKRKIEQKAQEREKKYLSTLSKIEDRLNFLSQEQQKLLKTNDPDPLSCLKRVNRLDPFMWSRSPDDKDFLNIRVGLGELLSSIKIKIPSISNSVEIDSLMMEAQKLAQRYTYVPQVPITISLPEYGVIGVAGPSDLRLDIVRNMILQLATHHSPDEVKLIAFYSEEENDEWNWIRWLPHTWSTDRKLRFLANTPEMAQELMNQLEEWIDQRLNILREKNSTEIIKWPYYFVFWLANEKINITEPLIQKLQSYGPRIGAFPIFVHNRVRNLPKQCRVVIRLRHQQPFIRIFTPSTHDILIIPDRVDRALANEFAVAMAPIRLQRVNEREIPTQVTLLELFQHKDNHDTVKTVEDLDVAKRWQMSQKATRSLPVALGLRAGGDPLILDLHERKHGPNGLVAGMVGAGKSELLQTLVASMAINYHPYKVGFVLIDYKGGGMADPFDGLPHTLGIITNLQKGNLAIRALTSFRVELERRMQLFKEASIKTGIDVNHIDTYQRLYYEGRIDKPLPYVVVIVDEFAEMKTEQPEVAKEFVKIARLGRAPGLCLILAMQKPAGIVDGQIEGNTRFRLCLRVASTEDSQTMLKRPDAAYLSGTGRAYLQVGANEVFELFQVAWSGAPYDPLGLLSSDPLAIVKIELNGQRKTLLEPSRNQNPISIDTTQLRAVVNHLQNVAKELKIEKLSGLWLPPLPELIFLEDILPPSEGCNKFVWSQTQDWITPIVGLIDNPKQQNQYPLRINLGKEGHLLVYGAPGYGKTTFIQTLITSLSLTYSPEDVHIYVMDFGGRLLKQFEILPHVGTVISADEPERLQRMFRFLIKTLDERRELFGAVGAGTLQAYRQIKNENLPAIVVILDNYGNFRDLYENYENDLIQITRDGSTLGIHVIITANDTSTIRFRLSSNINMAIALQMVETSDYAAIVGRTDNLVPANVPGRGLIRGNPPLEFQTALPAKGDTDAERARNLRKLLSDITASWKGPKAPPIRVMPSVVALFELLSSVEASPAKTRTFSDPLSVPLALDFSDLAPLWIDLNMGPNFLIVGPAQSGKTSLLQTWLIALAQQFSPKEIQFLIIDSRREGLRKISNLPHVIEYLVDIQKIEKALNDMLFLLEEREKARKYHNDKQLLDEKAILIVVDDILDPYSDNTNEEIRSLLLSIIRKGRNCGFYVIISGPLEELSSKNWIEPIKTLKSNQIGFMLGKSDDTIFNIRLPYSERDQILPAGEAYWIYRNFYKKIKLATVNCDSFTLNDLIQKLFNKYNTNQSSQ